MKPTVIAALLALSLHAAASEATQPGGDISENSSLVSPSGVSGPERTAIPETGAVLLGLVGAMLLLRRRRS